MIGYCLENEDHYGQLSENGLCAACERANPDPPPDMAPCDRCGEPFGRTRRHCDPLGKYGAICFDCLLLAQLRRGTT